MYQALYRKYRPQTFDEVVGQMGVTQTLKAQLQSGRLSHAYLFTGSRGTGKTSCAKILAKAVNCLSPVDGNPCNRCSACRSIDSGTCMDVLEIDAASNNGVDNVRDLRDDAIYTPAEVRTRVYIIDEVHMLSLSAFNALLKIIEEPPAHLLFILATTELHKVPATILSRCQRFAFRRLSPEDVARRVLDVANREGIALTQEAAQLLARLADGALRDGLSLLDQCASAAAGPVTAEAVDQCLGIAGERKAAAFLEAAANRDPKTALELFDRLYADGKDVAALLDELCALTRDLLVLKTAPKSGVAMLSGICSDQEVLALQNRFVPAELVRMLRVLQKTMAGFTRSGGRRMDGELCLLELCEPSLALDAQALDARLSRLEDLAASGAVRAEEPIQRAPAPPPEAEDLPWEQERPMPEDKDAPPELAAAEPAPMGFWIELAEKIRAELPPPLSGFFAPNGPVEGTVEGELLELRCANAFTQQMVGKPEVLELVGRQAAVLLGRKLTVQATDLQARPASNENLQQLLEFGRAHGDIVKIKT